MKNWRNGIFIGIVLLFVALPVMMLTLDVARDIYPKSSNVRLNQTMMSTFREQQGVHKRTCRRFRWFFVTMASYEPKEILLHYKEQWNKEPNPVSSMLVESEHQGRFFSIFSFTMLNVELSMEKYLGFVTQNKNPKEYTIGNYLFLCKLENWYE